MFIGQCNVIHSMFFSKQSLEFLNSNVLLLFAEIYIII